MKPDRRDIELLRLTGKYRWLPFDAFGKFGFENIAEDIMVLVKLGILSIARNKLYIRLSPKGERILADLGFDSDTAAKRPYENNVTLRHRLETASIMLTALRAGIDTLHDDVDALRCQPVFFPTFAFRSAAANSVSNSSSSGFGHWGGKAYMIHCVNQENKGMYLTAELKTFHNLSSVFSVSLDEPEALIFAGESYAKVYEQITSKDFSKKNGVKGFQDFSSVYSRTDVPIHLLSCDEGGAMQLALMRQPGYRSRLARAVYGDRWAQCDDLVPYADGIIDGNRTVIIAADMDVRRAVLVAVDAKRLGRKGVALIAFEGQMKGLLANLLPRDGFVSYLKIMREVIDTAFGKDFSLNALSDDEESGPAFGKDGHNHG
ncbi:MAG: hypothetical protein FWG48_06790 [Oscillospiraceae bacterium]|nr:hypothetical protein [Oscillospiraceae bacterium]